MLNEVASDHSLHSLGSFPRNLGRGDVLRDLCDWQFRKSLDPLVGGKNDPPRIYTPPKNSINYQIWCLKGKFDGGGGCPYSLADLDGGGVGGPKSAVTPVRSMRPTTLNSKISSISTTSRPLWSYGYTLWKAVYRNIRYTCINLEANITWGPGHAIRSSFPLDFSSLHHTRRRVFTVFYVTAM